MWREHGALEYRDLADDVELGKLTSFPRSVKLKPDETVVFSWIAYKSRVRSHERQGDEGQAARRHDGAQDVVFDGKRMIYGGFSLLEKV